MVLLAMWILMCDILPRGMRRNVPRPKCRSLILNLLRFFLVTFLYAWLGPRRFSSQSQCNSESLLLSSLLLLHAAAWLAVGARRRSAPWPIRPLISRSKVKSRRHSRVVTPMSFSLVPWHRWVSFPGICSVPRGSRRTQKSSCTPPALRVPSATALRSP